MPKNVIDIPFLNEKKLYKALKKIDNKSYLNMISRIKNPYGSGNSSIKVINVLKSMKNKKNFLMKEMTY